MASHKMALISFMPPSGGEIIICDGIILVVRVKGTTITSSALLLLKRSSEIIRTGRLPACSCVSFRQAGVIQESFGFIVADEEIKSLEVTYGSFLIPRSRQYWCRI
jgi:hypothetical protein